MRCHDVLHIIAVITVVSCALNHPELLNPKSQAHKRMPQREVYRVAWCYFVPVVF